MKPAPWSPRIVKTAPCPRCHSHATRAYIGVTGAVYVRRCFACQFVWDDALAVAEPPPAPNG